VAEHVRLHGGRVWSEDAPGGGTRFVVELPLHPADDGDTGDEAVDAGGTPGAGVPA
jgi:signal transduction histidine kinase